LQPDQARIVGLNAQYFLKNGGHYVISIKASCIDSTAQPEAVFAREVKKLQEMQLKPREQVRFADSLLLVWLLLAVNVCSGTARDASTWLSPDMKQLDRICLPGACSGPQFRGVVERTRHQAGRSWPTD
jgi:hypothetical protein